MSEINLSDFTDDKVILKLGKGEFIIKKPSVERFVYILDQSKKMGEGDIVKDIYTMIDILCSLVSNPGFLNIRRNYLRKILRSLDQDSITIIRQRTFLELGVDRLTVPTQPETTKVQ